MKAVLQVKDNAEFDKLYIAFELSSKKWKLGFSNGVKRRIKTIDAGNWPQLIEEISLAKSKLHCTVECDIVTCYEAGRDGFWIHRALIAEGIQNLVIDSASIEVSRRQKKVKTDRVDVIALLRLVMRYDNGEHEALQVLNVPSVEQEDERRLNRERERLIKERVAHSTRIKSLFVLHGIRIDKMREVPVILPTVTASVVGYDLPNDLKAEIRREYQRYTQVNNQIKELEKLQISRAKVSNSKSVAMINRLMQLKGVGWQSSWVMGMEFFAWRRFKNRKQVASCAGLSPTPYDSGDSVREQGISKAGNKRIRKICVELAWLWLRYQPKSKLSLWFEERFAHGGKRMRRIGIVAMARKLLIALWRYVEEGEVPEGAIIT